MTNNPTKPKQVRVYLNPQNEEMLRSLAANVEELSESQIATMLLSAGLKACADAGNRMPLPLKFEMSEGVLEEAKPLLKARR
jgi:hypothetical protein